MAYRVPCQAANSSWNFSVTSVAEKDPFSITSMAAALASSVSTIFLNSLSSVWGGMDPEGMTGSPPRIASVSCAMIGSFP